MQDLIKYNPEDVVFVTNRVFYFKNDVERHPYTTTAMGPALLPHGYCRKFKGKINGYYHVLVNGNKKLWHRILLNYHGELDVDHINGNITDNSIENLRIVCRQNNSSNLNKLQKNNTSGFRGVHFSKYKEKWTASLVINRKRINIGDFSTPQEANEARCKYIIDNNLNLDYLKQ